MTRTYWVSLAQDMKPLLNERRLAFSTSAEAKFSSIVAPNAGDWHERPPLGSAGSVHMTGTTRINWRNIPNCTIDGFGQFLNERKRLISSTIR
jgi:hypothetical protein